MMEALVCRDALTGGYKRTIWNIKLLFGACSVMGEDVEFQ
jgi:hypothetical protein